MTGPVAAQHPPAPTRASPVSSAAARPGRTLALIGLALLLVGIVGAAVLYVVASARYESAVDGFARAPVGCNTRLEFSQTGDFLVFVEHRGRLADVEGDCDAPSSYSGDADASPDGLRVSISRAGQADLDERRTDELSYDTSDYAGEAWRQVEVAEAGEYDIEVSATDASFAIAIGRNPNEGVAVRKLLALLSLLAGLLGGGLLLLMSSRSGKQPVVWSADAPTTHAQPGWPAGPNSPRWDPNQPPDSQMPVMSPPQMPVPSPPVAAAPPLRPPPPSQPHQQRPPPPQAQAPAQPPPPPAPVDPSMWRRPDPAPAPDESERPLDDR